MTSQNACKAIPVHCTLYTVLSLQIDDKDLVGRVADELSAAIIEGRIEPGARLREDQLALSLGVSRTPVREALRRLDRDGLVQITPRKGARVAAFTADDVAATYVCRAELLGLSAALAAATREEQDIARLKATLARLQAEATKRDAVAYFHCLNDFYGLIAEIAKNPVLDRLIQSLGQGALRLRFASLGAGDRLNQSAQASKQVVDAIVAGNSQAAEAIVRAATAAAGEALLAASYGIDLATSPARYRLSELVTHTEAGQTHGWAP